jgi:hydroxyacid-oxoacid transhydrogenase
MTTNPGELTDYINAPVGRGLAPANALKPLAPVPTTTGTGAESTTVCVLDVLEEKVKTGISHSRLRPTLAVIDMWSERALHLLSRSFRRAVADGGDAAARTDMALAATFAGLGFGNAGVHIPHANAYPIAGRVKNFRPEGEGFSRRPRAPSPPTTSPPSSSARWRCGETMITETLGRI